ncbi:hypothetical protein J2T02_003408 [Chitinophaga terrae (ex Kim and Jung 2007)]|uniref:DUF3857 domain-containing protein n=1 Tax=Chitinophaga terrae (ex Kim and Jung 2007) TaxID=408074 RepID=UPI00278172AD|nr:DUF3857 domain-containing protein [Chitinophaga terrae (ex Kim and Jung 2007)]MDQ0108280.1 hypothetical protein [Chitinophaga terrae (ex Kim and Jung 2007)]
MRKWIIFLTVGICIANITTAQINNYFPDTWKTQPESPRLTSDAPYTVVDNKLVADFNVSAQDKAEGCYQYKIAYKAIRINSQAGADSLHQLVLNFEPNDELRSMRVRAINQQGEITNLESKVRTVRLPGNRRAVVIQDLSLPVGTMVEYEIVVRYLYNTSGSEFLQTGLEAEHVDFRLTGPKNYTFRIQTTPGVPAIKDSTSGELQFHSISLNKVPAFISSDLFYTLPNLKRVDYAVVQAIEKKDTLKATWQQYGEENYIPYVAVSPQEFKKLERELQRLTFLARPMAPAQRIYLLEQYIKSNFTLVFPDETGATQDISWILSNKKADETGMIRLLNASYYLMNIPTQILFTGSRDSIPVTPEIPLRGVAKNVLLYFPTLNQALAPTEMLTRFPCYPSKWSGITALRCRDTLVGSQSKVLTDFITTPVVPYSFSNVTLEASLSDVQNPVWQVTQSFGGYPSSNIKTAFTKAGDVQETRNSLLNSLLPFQAGERRASNVAIENEVFTPYTLEKPVVLKSSLATPALVKTSPQEIRLRIGDLLGGTIPTETDIPTNNYPIQISFPYYQEKRINITVPSGFKLANSGNWNATIDDPALSYRIKCDQNGQQLTIFIIEWYKQNDLSGNSKLKFKAVQEKIRQIQKLEMVLTK